MPYFVLHPSGQRFGPADVALLNQWAAEGRLMAGTLVVDEASGVQVAAGQIPGLYFPGQAAQPTTAVPGSFTSNYARPATPGPLYTPGTGLSPTGLNASYILSGLSIGLALVCGLCPVPLPIPFAIAGLVTAFVAHSKGTRGSVSAIVLGFVALAISIAMFIVPKMILSGLTK